MGLYGNLAENIPIKLSVPIVKGLKKIVTVIEMPYIPVIQEIGANKRRVVRQIPDEIVNNLELQDAVRQVNNEKLHMTLGSLDPLTP